MTANDPLWFAMLNHFLKPTRLPLALLGAVLLAGSAFAQQPAAPVRDYSPSDATGEALAKYRPLDDEKKYDAAIAVLDAQIALTPAGSYDLALLSQIKAQTLMQKGDFSASIEPLEKGLILSDAKTPTFFDERVTRELVYFLAQLYFQDGSQSKVPAVALADYEKTRKYLERWATLVKKPTLEQQSFYAQVLYTLAVINPEHPDKALLQKALDQVEIGLRSAAHPAAQLYLFKLLCLQQLDRNAEAAEILELLVKQKPNSATYWQQLAALYLSTEQFTRAIITIERAQANGFMNTPKDNYNLIGIYFNQGQYEKAAELLETDLKSGAIENESKNWELLAFSYQQLERPIKGIEALKEATKAFPKSGQLEFMIAQAYLGIEQPESALPHAQAALAKGNLTKPSSVYLFVAYVAYQLKKYDIALDAAHKAAEFPQSAKEGKNMAKAIEDIIKEREAKKNKN
jgi:tetratricopeptide (TPR) repeat protein